MPLTRKIHRSGKSIVVTIPSQVAALYDLQSGENVEFIPLENGEIKFRKQSLEDETV